MKKQRGHYKLTPELIEKASRFASLGWTQKMIAEGCGVSEAQFSEWLNSGRKTGGTDRETELSKAIHEASTSAQARLVARISEGDTRDAQWLLTHSPRWRDMWSDAAATRREVNNTLATVVQVIQQCDLTPEQQDQILLRMQAAGLGAAAV